MQADIVVQGLRFGLLIPSQELQDRVADLGQRIAGDYRDKNPVFLGVLNGCFVFMADLIRHCTIPCEVSFIKLSSYDGLQSSGTVKTQIGLEMDIRGRHVVVVPVLAAMEPASVALAALIVKPEAMEFPLDITYRGFDIDNRFIIGYGLDYNGQARNLPGIFQLVSD